MRFGDLLATRRSYTIFLPQFNPQFAPARSRVHPHVVGNGARRSRRFNVARSPALAEYSNFLGFLTLKRPEGRAPWSRQLADARRAHWVCLKVGERRMAVEPVLSDCGRAASLGPKARFISAWGTALGKS